VWDLCGALRLRLAGAVPGAAHRALAAIGARAASSTLVTLAVDGLLVAAGARGVLELAGSLWRIRCTRCGARAFNREVPLAGVPSCPVCTGLARPDVLWDGEEAPRELLLRCHEALSACDALLVAGAAGAPQPRAAFIGTARRRGALVVEVSRGGTPEPAAEILLTGDPGELLPRLLD
jgi:NAD-dependent deacetylase